MTGQSPMVNLHTYRFPYAQIPETYLPS